MKPYKLGLLAAVGLAAVAAVRAGHAGSAAPGRAPESAKALAERACASCHGATGMAALPLVPNLAGQHRDYLVRQLRRFKAHDRGGPRAVENMWSVSHELTHGQIEALAAYFAQQRPSPQSLESSADAIAAGEAVYLGGAVARGVPACSACHGTDGRGGATAPRLAGQHATYLVRQLTAFQRSSDRPGAGAMKPVAHELTPENIASVAAYLQALPRISVH